jgi:hypothetical protein
MLCPYGLRRQELAGRHTSRLLKKAILAFFNSEIEKRGFRFPHVSERFETARKRRSIPGSLGRLFFNSLLEKNWYLGYDG